LKSLAVLEPASSKLGEAGFSQMEMLAGFWDSNLAGVYFLEKLSERIGMGLGG
jgi:hypothetical protein